MIAALWSRLSCLISGRSPSPRRATMPTATTEFQRGVPEEQAVELVGVAKILGARIALLWIGSVLVLGALLLWIAVELSAANAALESIRRILAN